MSSKGVGVEALKTSTPTQIPTPTPSRTRRYCTSIHEYCFLRQVCRKHLLVIIRRHNVSLQAGIFDSPFF
ncbi:unnamed protein product [Rotaria socialis]